MDTDSKCPICLELFEKNTNIIHLACCNNQIHFECLSTWIANNKSCPVCRNESNIHQIINIYPSECSENEPLIQNQTNRSSSTFVKFFYFIGFFTISCFSIKLVSN